jgi:hypothetical protein
MPTTKVEYESRTDSKIHGFNHNVLLTIYILSNIVFYFNIKRTTVFEMVTLKIIVIFFQAYKKKKVVCAQEINVSQLPV